MNKKLVVGITAEGSVNLLRGQLLHFKSLGYDTYLLAPYSDRVVNYCKEEGCEHLSIDIAREISIWQDIKTLISIFRIFRKVKPDIVNLGTPKVALLGMIAAYLLRINKRIYTCRGFRFEHEGGNKKKILVTMEKITSACAHQIICISPSVKKLGMENGIFKNEKATVIGKGSSNGINLSLFNPLDEKLVLPHKALLSQLSLEGYFVFSFVGRIVDRKGVVELFEAFNRLFQRNSKIRLLIVGPFETSQIVDKTIIEKIQQHPGVVAVGKVPQEQVPLYLSISDVFVLPAWWEGFGNVLIQAAAMGIPVISTNGTGTVDAVCDGYNGILVPIKDSKALESAMDELLANELKRKEMGENGKKWALHFDQSIIWKGMQDLYNN